MFSPGQQIELLYPVSTDVSQIESAARKLRQLYVHRVRDLVEEPLSISEFIRRPYVARSRWLVLASEVDGERPKQFYVGTADNYRAPGSLQLALYRTDDKRPHALISRQFEPTVRDRLALLKLLQRIADCKTDVEPKIVATDTRVLL